MRQGWALGLGLLLTALLAGCANDRPARTTSWFDRWRPFHGAAAQDVVELQISLVERPPGDVFINRELWTLADEQIIPLERKAALEANGFRVGQLGGNTPAGLLTLLTSTRSNVNPRRFFLHAGQSTLVVLGPVTPRCSFQFQQDGEPADVALEKAQCAFQVVPSLAGESGIRLQFTPQVRYGEKALVPRAAPDGSGFQLQEEWPTKTYASLGWEVTLATNQYVVVGARSDRPESLGCQCFVRRAEPVPVQRLLAIRTCRLAAPPPTEVLAESGDEATPPSRTPPLALQAAWTKARGCAP
jgi:hypothetical protein